jgi:hypothetical protein
MAPTLATDTFTQHLQADYRTSGEQYAMCVWQETHCEPDPDNTIAPGEKQILCMCSG